VNLVMGASMLSFFRIRKRKVSHRKRTPDSEVFVNNLKLGGGNLKSSHLITRVCQSGYSRLA